MDREGTNATYRDIPSGVRRLFSDPLDPSDVFSTLVDYEAYLTDEFSTAYNGMVSWVEAEEKAYVLIDTDQPDRINPSYIPLSVEGHTHETEDINGLDAFIQQASFNQYQFINEKTTDPADRVLSYSIGEDNPSLRYHIFIEDSDDPFEFTLPAGLDPGWNGKIRLTGSGSVVLMAGQGTTVTTESGDYDVGTTEDPVATGVIGYKYGVVDVQHLGGDNWLVEGDLA